MAVAALVVTSVACSGGTAGYGNDDEQRVLASCVGNGEPRAVCQCIYDGIVKKVPYKDYVAQDKRRQKDPSYLLPAIEKIAIDCAAKASSSN
jgi:hypothetical protein